MEIKATPIELSEGKWFLRFVWSDGTISNQAVNDSTTYHKFAAHTKYGVSIEFFESREKAMEYLNKHYFVHNEQGGSYNVKPRLPVEKPHIHIYDAENEYGSVHMEWIQNNDAHNSGIAVYHVKETPDGTEQVSILVLKHVFVNGMLVLKGQTIDNVYEELKIGSNIKKVVDTDKYCKNCEYPCEFDESREGCQAGMRELLEFQAERMINDLGFQKWKIKTKEGKISTGEEPQDFEHKPVTKSIWDVISMESA